MVLETLTLIVLASALLIKYGTSTHLSKLNQRQIELQNLCQEYQGRHNSLVEEHKVAEQEERDLKLKIASLETNLEDLQGGLEEQEERNRKLSDRITGG